MDEPYIRTCNVYLDSKTILHKPYEDLQLLLVLKQFIQTKRLKSIIQVLVIVELFTKIVNYELV